MKYQFIKTSCGDTFIVRCDENSTRPVNEPRNVYLIKEVFTPQGQSLAIVRMDNKSYPFSTSNSITFGKIDYWYDLDDSSSIIQQLKEADSQASGLQL